MAKVEYYKNVISNFYKDELLNQIVGSLGDPIWSSSHRWSEVLHKNMRPIMIRFIESEKETLNNIINSISPTVHGLTPTTPLVYVWEPGSHIDWHDDEGWKAAASIYLTTQDKRGGGAFAWEDNGGECHMIFPEECSVIIQSDKTNHHVTMIHPTNSFYRISLQIFYK